MNKVDKRVDDFLKNVAENYLEKCLVQPGPPPIAQRDPWPFKLLKESGDWFFYPDWTCRDSLQHSAHAYSQRKEMRERRMRLHVNKHGMVFRSGKWVNPVDGDKDITMGFVVYMSRRSDRWGTDKIEERQSPVSLPVSVV